MSSKRYFSQSLSRVLDWLRMARFSRSSPRPWHQNKSVTAGSRDVSNAKLTALWTKPQSARRQSKSKPRLTIDQSTHNFSKIRSFRKSLSLNKVLIVTSREVRWRNLSYLQASSGKRWHIRASWTPNAVYKQRLRAHPEMKLSKSHWKSAKSIATYMKKIKWTLKMSDSLQKTTRIWSLI